MSEDESASDDVSSDRRNGSGARWRTPRRIVGLRRDGKLGLPMFDFVFEYTVGDSEFSATYSWRTE
jgi:hypothetical protein